jgi:hypothetical protein
MSNFTVYLYSIFTKPEAGLYVCTVSDSTKFKTLFFRVFFDSRVLKILYCHRVDFLGEGEISGVTTSKVDPKLRSGRATHCGQL